MPKAGGYLVITEADGRKKEFDTFSCCHCNQVVVLDPQDPAMGRVGFCMKCSKRTCPKDQCKCCTPFMRKVERLEDEAYHRQARGY